MKKLDNFSSCLEVLKSADFSFAAENDIYRTGIIGQFNLTFELAWKALKDILSFHGVQTEGAAGSPREILQLGYKYGFISDSEVWLMMLKKNNSVHIYNEAETDEMLALIRDSFIPEFTILEKALREKLKETSDNSL